MRTLTVRLSPLLAVPLVAGLMLTGCGAGDTIDPEKTGIALRFDVQEATGEPVKSVECPSDVPVEVGNRFRCHVIAASGGEAVVEVEVTSEKADLRALSIEPVDPQ